MPVSARPRPRSRSARPLVGIRAARRHVDLVGADGAAAPMSLPSAMPRRYLLGAAPGVDLVLEPDRRVDPGDRLVARPRLLRRRRSGSSPSASGTHASRSVTYPTRSARPARLHPHADARSRPRGRVDHVHHRACRRRRASPARTRTACRGGACRAAARRPTSSRRPTPAGPDLDELVERGARSSGRTRSAAPSRARRRVRTPTIFPSRRPREVARRRRADRARVAAGVLEDVMLDERCGHVIASLLAGRSDRGLAVGPVRVAQLALQQLAGGLARQLVHEVDRPRPLELRQPAARGAP